MPPEYVDYLILGDEHHGETYSDIKSTRLAVRSKYASHAKRAVDDAPAAAPKMIAQARAAARICRYLRRSVKVSATRSISSSCPYAGWFSIMFCFSLYPVWERFVQSDFVW